MKKLAKLLQIAAIGMFIVGASCFDCPPGTPEATVRLNEAVAAILIVAAVPIGWLGGYIDDEYV